MRAAYREAAEHRASEDTLGYQMKTTLCDLLGIEVPIILAPIISPVGPPAGIPRIPLNLVLLKGCQIVGVFWGAFAEREAATNQRNNRELVEMYSQGTLRPHVSARFPLAEGGAAIKALAERRVLGKLVVTID